MPRPLPALLAGLLLAAASGAGSAAEPAEDLCATGRNQSPIAISSAAARPSALRNPTFRYRPAGVVLQNTGHTLKVEYASSAVAGGGGDNLMLLDDTAFRLIEFHFHRPGEHPLDGAMPPMELHLVHGDARGNLAVVGVALRLAKEDNPALAPLWAALPPEAGDRRMLPALFDAGALLPGPPAVTFRYPGSLTTPPCSEGVRWSVFDRPIPISQGQYDAYAGAFPEPYARDPQPANGRVPLRTLP